VNDPAQKNKPKYCRKHKLNDCDQQSALQQLPESRDKETAKCSDDISG
jgi:hypothetical protein